MAVVEKLRRAFSKERREGVKESAEQERRVFGAKYSRFKKKYIPGRSRVVYNPASRIAPRRLGRAPFQTRKTKHQGRTGQRGRGRLRGSYKYFIPGKGPVSVFEWRRHLSQQKQLMKMRLQQIQAQQVASPTQQQMLRQQIQQQMLQRQQVQVPVSQGQLPIARIQEPVYDRMPGDMRIWEAGPGLGLNVGIQQQPQMIQEVDLATGQIRLKRGGSFL